MRLRTCYQWYTNVPFQLPSDLLQSQLEKERRELQKEEGQQSRYASEMSSQIYKEAQVWEDNSPGLLFFCKKNPSIEYQPWAFILYYGIWIE